MTLFEEKQAVDDFMRQIGVAPRHNVLYCTKELGPNLRQALRFDEPATYEFLFTSSYLVIFTENEVILKKIGKWSFYKNLEPAHLEKGLTRIPKSAVKEFSAEQVAADEYRLFFTYQNKPYHFYLHVSEERKQIDFSATNFERLREQHFYGLLKPGHPIENPQAVQDSKLKTFAMLYSVISFLAVFALHLPQNQLILGGGLALLATFITSFLGMDKPKFPLFRWLVILLLAASFGVYLFSIVNLT